MASGDVVLSVNNVMVWSDDLERAAGDDGHSVFSLSTGFARNQSAFGGNPTSPATVVLTPSSSFTLSSAKVVLARDTNNTVVGVNNLFDAAKLYKITISEV